MAIKAANDKSMSNITSLPSGVSAKSLILISTQTASSSATISFTSGIDSTYDEYVFKFYDIHPETDQAILTVNFRDGSSAYDATKTTTSFQSYNLESGGTPAISYSTGYDVAQGTGVQNLSGAIGNDNDQQVSGYLQLFNPASTTFVKNFIAVTNTSAHDNSSVQWHIAGYCNVTAAIDGVQFAMSSNAIDAGTIKMYGVV